MFRWNGISSENLDFILSCNEMIELESEFSHEFTTQLLTEANRLYKIKIKKHKISQSFFSALTGESSYGMATIWTVIGLGTLTQLPIIFMTGGLATATLITGVVYFFSTYQDIKAEAKKTEQFFQLHALKNRCLDEMLIRKHEEMIRRDYELRHESVPAFQPVPGRTWPKAKAGVKATIMVGSLLFVTYYLSIGVLFGAFGLAAVSTIMMGPIGLGVALAISLGIGLYFGYKQYQAAKNTEEIKNKQDELLHEIHFKKTRLDELNRLSHHLSCRDNAHPVSPKKYSPEFKSQNQSPAYRYGNNPMILASAQHGMRHRKVNQQQNCDNRMKYKKE